MASASFVVESALTAGAAYDRLIDLSRVPEWDRGIKVSRLIDGEVGAVGARYELELLGFDGQPTTAVYELVSVDSMGFTMVGTHPEFRADDTVTIEPASAGCRLTYDAALVLPNDDGPMTNAQLDTSFSKIVAVAEAGLRSFLNP